MFTRRVIGATTVLLMVAGAAPAAGGPRPARPRVVESRYDLPTVAVRNVGGLCYACFTFSAGPGETSVDIEAADDVSDTVLVGYGIDLNGDTFSDEWGYFCGSNEFSIRPYSKIFVSVYANPPLDREQPTAACPGVATSGSVKLTFRK